MDTRSSTEQADDSESHRIAVVGPAHPYRGGIAHFNEMTMRGLIGRGHDVRAVTFERQYPEMLFPGRTQLAEGPPPEGVPQAERLIDTLNPLTWWRAARRIERMDPDTVVFQFWMPFFAPAYGLIARWMRRKEARILAVIHNALPHERHLGDKTLGRFFLRTCDGFVVMSDAVASDLRKLRRAEAEVRRIEHPLYTRFGKAVPRDEARVALDLPANAPVILFFGFIREYKGLHVLLEAMPQIAGHLPNVRLVVAGEFYDDPDRYRDIVQQHSLGERVIVHDRYIPGDDVPLFFSAADVVAQPYISATQSGVAQIAFHFNTPVVVTDVGGLAEVVPHEEAGLVVAPENPHALAQAIVRFFAEGMRDDLADGVRQQKRKYHPDRLYDAIEDLM